VLPAARWRRLPRDLELLPPHERLAAEGRELFRLECTQCHTADGYLAIRPLVRGAAPGSIDLTLMRLHGWRGRRMPPFVGTPGERRALAIYLATLDGRSAEEAARSLAPEGPGEDGHALFETNCSICHGRDAEFPFAKYAAARPRSADAYYELLGRLDEINDMMPAFDASESQRRALARYLAGLSRPTQGGGR
jgi:mono/diheme cytochrome c family protein